MNAIFFDWYLVACANNRLDGVSFGPQLVCSDRLKTCLCIVLEVYVAVITPRRFTAAGFEEFPQQDGLFVVSIRYGRPGGGKAGARPNLELLVQGYMVGEHF